MSGAAVVIFCGGRRTLAYGDPLRGFKCATCGRRMFWLVTARGREDA